VQREPQGQAALLGLPVLPEDLGYPVESFGHRVQVDEQLSCRLATLGLTVGPYAGGWLVDDASWRWLFLLNAPLVVIALLVLVRVPESRGPQATSRPDVPGGLLAVAPRIAPPPPYGGIADRMNQEKVQA
jgi:Major Facilitator Superfamily